jgi:hypothetical protein
VAHCVCACKWVRTFRRNLQSPLLWGTFLLKYTAAIKKERRLRSDSHENVKSYYPGSSILLFLLFLLLLLLLHMRYSPFWTSVSNKIILHSRWSLAIACLFYNPFVFLFNLVSPSFTWYFAFLIPSILGVAIFFWQFLVLPSFHHDYSISVGRII